MRQLFILFLNSLILFPFAIFILIIKKVDSLASVLISSPFDNFRIECPQTSGAQRLAIRMVESQGQKRQDTVFVLSCQQIGDLYPWLEIPEELADQEHEECHYTQQFDILLDKQMNWTCAGREYLAGIARLSDTRIQLECCKLRTRTEGNCVEYDYDKPAGSGARVEIEYQGKLINALAVYGDLIRVRFCDLSPRPIEDIMAETTQTTPSVIPVARSVTSSGNKFLLRPPTNSVGFSSRIEAPTLLNDPRTLAKQRATNSLQNQNTQTVPPSIIEEELPPANILADGTDEAFSMDEKQQQNEQIKQTVEHKNVQAVQEKVEPIQNIQQETVHQVEPVQQRIPQVQPVQEQKHKQLNITSSPLEQKEEQPVQPVNVQSMLEMSPINVKKSASQQEQPQTSEGQEQQNNQENKNSEINSPRIKVYGHNPLRTVQFGRILQAVGERRKELAVKILRHHKFPPDHVQSLEYGKRQKHDEQEQINEEKQQNKEEAQNEQTEKSQLEQKHEEKQQKGQQQNERTYTEETKQEHEKHKNEEQSEQLKENIEQQKHEQKQEEIQENIEQQKHEQKQEEIQEDIEEQKHEKHEVQQNNQQKHIQEEIKQLQEEKHLEENKQKQTSQHLENSIAKAAAAKKQIFEPIKSNLLLRRRGMHEQTFTLTPLQPVDVSVGDNKGKELEDREKAELTIQRRIDAIRAAEKRMQIKTIQIPKEENKEGENTWNTTNKSENVIASKQNDWEPNSESTVETTDQYFSTMTTSDAFDGEAMHRILFGEPVQITPKTILNKIINENNSKDLNNNLNKIENKQLNIETINLIEQTTTQSPAAIWWEPMVTAGRTEGNILHQNNQNSFINGKQINDQLGSETTLLPFTLPSDDPIAKEVKENALLAPQRSAVVPKNKLRIYSLNYGNLDMRKQISEIKDERMESSEIENNKNTTTLAQNLNEMNTSINVDIKQNTETTDKNYNKTDQLLSIHKSLPIYTLKWEEEKKQHFEHKKDLEQKSEQFNNKTVLSPAEESVETLFPPQINVGNDNLNQNESKFIENKTKSTNVKSNRRYPKKKQPPPPTSEEFADIMLREIGNQEKVPFSFSPPQSPENTTINSQINFPRQFDDPKTLSHKKRIVEENNDEKFVDYYYVDEISSKNLTHASLSRRSPKADTDINENISKALKNETIGENNELKGKRKEEKKRKIKKKKKLEEKNEQQLPSLDSFPSPPPLNSRNKIAVIAAASAKQFAQLPPTPTGIKQQQKKNVYKKELEQRREQINQKTAESVAIELASASKDSTNKEETINNVAENLDNKNKKKKHKNREKHLKHEREQKQPDKHEEREENIENKHEEKQQQKQIKEYRNQQFAALIATSSQPMRMGVDYEVADEDGNENKEIYYSSSSTRLPKTTRLPLFKRKQLDRIALEVFGPSAFDPSIEHPPIDASLLSRRPLTQKFRHRPSPSKQSEGPLETSTGMPMGLPDEETDISPFDEREKLLERLRYNHKNKQENIEEAFDDNIETSQHKNQPQNPFDTFNPSIDSSTTISLPNFENNNQNFGQLNVQKNGRFERVESRFEKASPFDDRHEEEHFEDEEEPHSMASKIAEIRRKPSLTSIPLISPSTHFNQDKVSSINTEAAVKRSISHKFLRKDGNPSFTPKDNKPMMKMPFEMNEKINKIDNEQNNINPNEAQSLNELLVPMNEEMKKQNQETTKTLIQTTTQIDQQNINLNNNKNNQKTNREGSGNNYWRFFVEPNIYTTTTVSFPFEQQHEEQTVFYNADKYFRFPNRRENKNIQRENENVLTFCSKASAIRDSSNLPIACAGEDGQIWQPQRCPPGTGCMPAADSAFHICCPVGIASINRRK